MSRHKVRISTALRDVAALPPEGSSAQQQDSSGKTNFLTLKCQLTFDVDSDDDILMPDGPPPGVEGETVDSDDDIPMPEGPPPGKGQGEYAQN